MVDADYITIVNAFLAETSKTLRIVSVRRDLGLVEVVGVNGATTKTSLRFPHAQSHEARQRVR